MSRRAPHRRPGPRPSHQITHAPDTSFGRFTERIPRPRCLWGACVHRNFGAPPLLLPPLRLRCRRPHGNGALTRPLFFSQSGMAFLTDHNSRNGTTLVGHTPPKLVANERTQLAGRPVVSSIYIGKLPCTFEWKPCEDRDETPEIASSPVAGAAGGGDDGGATLEYDAEDGGETQAYDADGGATVPYDADGGDGGETQVRATLSARCRGGLAMLLCICGLTVLHRFVFFHPVALHCDPRCLSGRGALSSFSVHLAWRVLCALSLRSRLAGLRRRRCNAGVCRRWHG